MKKNAPVRRWPLSAILTAAAFIAGLSTGKVEPAARGTASSVLRKTSVVDFAAPAGPVTRDPDSEYREAVARMGERPGSEAGYDAILRMLMQWVAADPQAALAYVKNHYDARHRSAFLSSMLGEWAGKDGRAALDWTTTNLPHDYVQYDAVLSAIGKNDPHAAWRYAGELAANEEPQNAPSIYVSALRGIIYDGNYQQAAGLIANVQLPGTGDKSDLSGILASQWGLYDPTNAAQWAAALPMDTGLSLYRRQSLVNLGVAWAQSDPQAAADFALQLPAGVDRQNMLTTALAPWAASQPDQAAQWLNQTPPDPNLNLVVQSLASSPNVVDADPGAAIAWANAITDDDPVRLQTLSIIMMRWMAEDPEAAQNYLNNSTDLSPDIVAALKRHLNLNAGN